MSLAEVPKLDLVFSLARDGVEVLFGALSGCNPIDGGL